MCPNCRPIFRCIYIRSSVIWHLHDWKAAISLSIPFIKQNLYWPKFLQEFFLVCLSTLGGQQSNLVCCHNDTPACSTSRFPNYFLCPQTCWYLVPSCASNCVFTYFGIFGSHYNSSVGSVKYRLQNVNHSTRIHTGRYWLKSFWM